MTDWKMLINKTTRLENLEVYDFSKNESILKVFTVSL